MKRRVGDSEEIDLVLELSTDLDEEEVPTIVNNTRKKGESRKRSRKTSSFMDNLGEALEDNIQAKIARVDSRPLSKYEQIRDKNIAEIRQMEDELFGEV